MRLPAPGPYSKDSSYRSGLSESEERNFYLKIRFYLFTLRSARAIAHMELTQRRLPSAENFRYV